jgi:hypothetical protein
MCKIESKELLREEVETYFWEKIRNFFVIIFCLHLEINYLKISNFSNL